MMIGNTHEWCVESRIPTLISGSMELGIQGVRVFGEWGVQIRIWGTTVFYFRLKRLKTRSLGIAKQSYKDIFMKECVNFTKYCLNGDRILSVC